MNKVLEWEENHYPAVIVGVVTFIFSIIWYLEPSVLTTFSLLGVLLCMLDFIVPTLSSYMFSSSEWTVVQERQFETICGRILNAKQHIKNLFSALSKMKNNNAKMYLVMMMGAFSVMAWVGSLIDNLLLTYLLVVFLFLVPGLRKHGILQKFTSGAMEFATRMIRGKEEKKKTN